ncbi:MAG: 5'/3'-nucleotidase SurE [Candidatus Cloacimonetes bacterium]|nr:5'/3'-nucleotidase SurE [Candidatus Cloacimonadota bacterium]MCF7814804.1 5'/3'-nucleotidase SurE [Candidatus Cloacimonadota bacterium]MCF7869201.1 5'/3'-nucleotidase SurE [Candidatus Cloacimonadota bacterium]MCF7884628.1 5'/3'-nucleotidase SurE [Candidatus Cloacimonadota bacterium]
MRILLTNDDGIDAPGIKTLEKTLKENGHEVIVVAPSKEQSATSHSLTLHEPLRIYERGENRFAVTGSPADCAIIAERIVLKEKKVDLVISGINAGQNMGEDLLYSGTVAAALEAMFLGFKSIAISLASYSQQKFETAAHFINEFIKNGLHENIEEREILNINVPNLEIDEIKGIRITEVGHRKYQDFVKEQLDPRGRKIYWIGGGPPWWDRTGNSDFKAISEGFISITPITPTFCRKEAYPKLEKWLDDNK